MTKEKTNTDIIITNNRIHTRQSNFELLRIVATIMIVFCHSLYFPGIVDNVNKLTGVNYYFVLFFKSFGQVGVVLFILVSAYFLCCNKFNSKSYLKLILQNIFYIICVQVAVAVINCVQYDIPFFSLDNLDLIVKGIFTMFTANSWFVGVYFTMYLIFPFLNIIVHKTTKKQLLFLIGVLVMSLIVLSSLLNIEIANNEIVSNLAWWLAIYFTAAYIRLYPEDFKSKLMPVIGIAFCLFIKYLELGSKFYEFRNGFYTYFLALFIFILFKNLNIKNSKMINVFASASFGVYLMHDDSFLWKDLIKFLNYKYLFLIITGVVLLTIVSITILDLLRQYLFEKPLFKYLTNKHASWFISIDKCFPVIECKNVDNNEPINVWYGVFLVLILASVLYVINSEMAYIYFVIAIAALLGLRQIVKKIQRK